MRSTILTAFAALGIVAGTSAAVAAPVNGAVINDAANSLRMTEQVHCVPGWPHHWPTEWRRQNGCPRFGGVVVVPRFHHFGFRHHHHRFHHHHHFRRHHFRHW